MLGSLYIPVVPLVQGNKKDRARYQAERIAYLKEVYPLDTPIDAGFQRNRVNSMDEEKIEMRLDELDNLERRLQLYEQKLKEKDEELQNSLIEVNVLKETLKNEISNVSEMLDKG